MVNVDNPPTPGEAARRSYVPHNVLPGQCTVLNGEQKENDFASVGRT